jgi:hypothetical protein
VKSAQSQNPSRRRQALLIATAALAPSAMATATSRTSRDTSPGLAVSGATQASAAATHGRALGYALKFFYYAPSADALFPLRWESSGPHRVKAYAIS